MCCPINHYPLGFARSIIYKVCYLLKRFSDPCYWLMLIWRQDHDPDHPHGTISTLIIIANGKFFTNICPYFFWVTLIALLPHKKYDLQNPCEA
jgi:hypothetical protein